MCSIPTILATESHGFDIPGSRSKGEMRSFLFPQMGNPVGTDLPPKLGEVKVVAERCLRDSALKQCRIVKVSGWYAMLVLAADVNVPAPMPHGQWD